MVNQRELDLSAGRIPVRDYTLEGPSLAISRGQGLQQINFEQAARGLAWASLGLGLVKLLAPGSGQRLVGVRRGDHSGLIRLVGIRELIDGLLILTMKRPQTGVWSRVAGDVMDLGLLGRAYAEPRNARGNLIAAAIVVLCISAADVLTATQLGRKQAKMKGYGTLVQEDLNAGLKGGAFHVTRSITINRSSEELYSYWRTFENLPKFMAHLVRVQVLDDRHSHWVAKAPAGTSVAWDAEITVDKPNELITWQSTGDADVTNSGQVHFERAPRDQGTVVRVEIDYRPPAGVIGKTIAALFGEEPGQQVAADLRRFKQVMETGEVVRSEGSPEGFGQVMQRPARPVDERMKKERSRLAREQKLYQREQKREQKRERTRIG